LKLSLLGTILSSLLLTTGLSFLLGGWNRTEQYFNVSLAQMVSMLLLLAVSSLIIPTCSMRAKKEMTPVHMTENGPVEYTMPRILSESRGISIVIICTYALWVFFTLSTHSAMFSVLTRKVPKTSNREIGEGIVKRLVIIGAITAATSGGVINQEHLHNDSCDEGKEEDLEECSLSLAGAIIALITSVIFLGFNTQFATDSIQTILQRTSVSQAFLSVIILPLLSNDPLAIKMAIRDRMDMSISLTLERCMQTCLLVIPLTVLLAWCMGVDEIDLNFDMFFLTVLFLPVFIVSLVIRRGKSNW
jgi:Ca2+:H+ antiporter